MKAYAIEGDLHHLLFVRGLRVINGNYDLIYIDPETVEIPGSSARDDQGRLILPERQQRAFLIGSVPKYPNCDEMDREYCYEQNLLKGIEPK